MKPRSQREQLRLVGVGGEPVERPDRRPDRHLLAGDARRRRAADEVPAERALALVADEQDRGRRVVQQALRVAHRPAAGEHPVRRDDHVRRRRLRDRLATPGRSGRCAGPGSRAAPRAPRSSSAVSSSYASGWAR